MIFQIIIFKKKKKGYGEDTPSFKLWFFDRYKPKSLLPDSLFVNNFNELH